MKTTTLLFLFLMLQFVSNAQNIETDQSQQTDFNLQPSKITNNSNSENAPPSNDNAANAILLSDNSTCNYTHGTVDNATDDGFPLLPTCNGNSSTQYGVFYKFVASTTTATITVDPDNTTSTGLDAVVVVYSGSNVYNLQQLNKDACLDPTGKVEVVLPITGLVAEQTYWIRIYDWGSGQPAIGNGGFSICVTHSTSAIDEVTVSEKINLFPNPTNGVFDISEIEAFGNKCKIEVFNQLGKSILINEYESFGNKIKLDLSTYPSGMYLIRISNDGINCHKKIIKK